MRRWFGKSASCTRNASPDRFPIWRNDTRRRPQGRNRDRCRSPPRSGARRATASLIQRSTKLRPAFAIARGGQGRREAGVPRKRAYARALRAVAVNRQAAEKRGRGAETLACWYLRLRAAHSLRGGMRAGRRGRCRRASRSTLLRQVSAVTTRSRFRATSTVSDVSQSGRAARALATCAKVMTFGSM